MSKRKRKTEENPMEEDERLLSFKTLLPHVKRIRPEPIFPFRAQMQDVVQRFAYPMGYHVESPPAVRQGVC